MFEKFNFKDVDYNKLQEAIDLIKWDTLLQNLNVEDSINIFYNTIYEIINKYVKKKFIKSSTYPKWFSYDLKQLLIKKIIAHKIYKITCTQKSYDEFSELRMKCKIKSNEDYKIYISSVEKNLKLDTKQFWIYLNNKKSSREYPTIMKYKKKICNNNDDISNLFAEYFCDIYKDGDPNLLNNYFNDLCNKDDDINIEINRQEIINSIKRMNSNVSVGPDGIPSILIKESSSSLISPLYNIFNKSLKESCLPSKWKLSYIIPVYKNKGDISHVENYRPITIISAIPKLLDCIISEKIYNNCIDKISRFQHGSVEGKSIQTNLLHYTNFINSKLNINSQVDAIYTYFNKVFDMVNHKLLRGYLLNFFTKS